MAAPIARAFRHGRHMSTAATSAELLPPHCLVSISFSTYCEKARWALDHLKIPYEERLYVPGFHAVGVIAAGGFSGKADNQSTRFSTPLLVTRDGLQLHDSHAIVRWASDHHSAGRVGLYGAGGAGSAEDKEICRLEQHFTAKLGPNTRRVAYYYALNGDPEGFTDMCLRNLPKGSWQARLLAVPAVRDRLLRFVLSGTGATAERAQKSRGHILKEFDAVAELLSRRGEDHLVGSTLSAADISFAALAYPVLGVQPADGLGCYFPPPTELPEAYQDMVSQLRAHPAGAFAMRLYHQWRGSRVIPRVPPLAPTQHDMLSSGEGKQGKRGGGLGTGVV